MMKVKRSLLLYVVPTAITIGSLLPILLLRDTLWGGKLFNEPLHNTIEAMGVLASIVIAWLLFQEKHEKYNEKYFLLATGFLTMGLFDGLHVVIAPGQGVVLLRSIAALSGGFWFALVWLPRSVVFRIAGWKKWLPFFVAAGSILFGIYTLLFRETLPLMVEDGKFTITAVAINQLAGVFFLTAAGRLLIDFRHSDKTEIYLFACTSLLFGLSSLVFPYSQVWSPHWWWWHLLRLIACLLIIVLLTQWYEQKVSNLRVAISERKLAEEALQENLMLIGQAKQEWESTVDSIPQLICLIDDQGCILRANRTVEQWNLGQIVDVKGKCLHELLHPGCADSACYLETFWSQAWEELKHGRSTECEINDRVLGRYINIQVRPISPEIYRKGENITSYAAIVIYDITERKRQEDAFERIHHQNELILNSAGEGILGVDLQGNHTFVNPSAARMFGYEIEELIGRHSHTTWHHRRPDGSPYPPEECKIYAAFRNGGNHTVEDEVFWRKDGTSFPVRYTSTSILEDGKLVGAVVTFRDITERKQSEELLQVRVRMMEFAATHSLEELLQKTLDEVCEITESPIGFYHFVDEDQKTLGLQAWSTRTLREFCTAEGKGLHYGIDKAGVWVDCIYERRPVIHNDYASLPHRKGMPEGHAEVIRELVVPIFRNDRIKAVLGVGNKQSDYTQKDVELVSFLADVAWEITGRKRIEEDIRRLNEELELKVIQRTAQLEAANKELEAFSYSVSHDLRAPLRAISGFSGMLLEDYVDKLDDEGKRLLNIVQSNAQKMGELIDGLLAFSRMERKEIELLAIDMEKMAHAVFNEVQSLTPERPLQFKVESLPSAHGDPLLINQVFFNLLSNAIKFTRLRETAVIEVSGYAEGSENVYYVKDNGAGFDMQYADKLFGAFQRQHSGETFEGTGIGLATVQRIIHRHGGRVWAEGKVNEGATFYFALPSEKMLNI